MPSTYVYIALYDLSGHVLIALKNDLGYFFHNKNAPGGRILPNGQPLNGAGKEALPGGKPDNPVANATDARNAAVSEFQEETGLALATFGPSQRIPAFHCTEKTGDDYWGVCLHTDSELDDVLKACEATLLNAENAAEAVKAKRYGANDYDRLLHDFATCPVDNELAGMRIVDLTTQWNEIQPWQNTPDQGWHYNILDYLRNNCQR